VVDGSEFTDNLIGTDKNDLIRGYGGNDVLFGYKVGMKDMMCLMVDQVLTVVTMAQVLILSSDVSDEIADPSLVEGRICHSAAKPAFLIAS
jgi:hypothetical protein